MSEGNKIAPEETKTDQKDDVPKVILHQFPSCKAMPSMSPFALKLETFLRLAKVPYENLYSLKTGSKGKIPWIEYNGVKKDDSSFIIDYLTEILDIKTDCELSEMDRAIGRVVKVTLEENFTWVLANDRLNTHGAEFRAAALPPGFAYSIAYKLGQRKLNNTLNAQGIGRHSKEEIQCIGQKDLYAVSVILGDKPYLLGSKPTTYDCSVFGFTAQLIHSGLETDFVAYMKEKTPNLISHCKRMKDLCWPDWEESLPKEEESQTSQSSQKASKKQDEVPSNDENKEKTTDETKN